MIFRFWFISLVFVAAAFSSEAIWAEEDSCSFDGYGIVEGTPCTVDSDCSACADHNFQYRKWVGVCEIGQCNCIPNRPYYESQCGEVIFNSDLLGDVNLDGSVNIIDIVVLVNSILGTGAPPPCFERADVNHDFTLNILDIVGIVSSILGTGALEPFDLQLGCGGDAAIYCEDCIFDNGICWAGPSNIYCCNEFLGGDCKSRQNSTDTWVWGSFCSYDLCFQYSSCDEEIPYNGVDDDCDPNTPNPMDGMEAQVEVVTEIVFNGAFQVIEKIEYGATVDTVMQTEYNVLGQPFKITDPMGHLTMNTYDALGRPAKVINPDLSEKTFGFLGLSQLMSYPFDATGIGYVSRAVVTDEKGQPIYSFRDALGRERQKTMGEGQTRIVKKDFDILGNVIDIQDPIGRAVTYERNLLGWVKDIHHPDLKGRTITYNQLGQQTGEAFYDQSSRSDHGFDYDTLGRIIGKSAGSTQTVYEYDDLAANGKGRLTRTATLAYINGAIRPTTIVSYHYDLRGRVTAETHQTALANNEYCNNDSDCATGQVCLENTWANFMGLCGERFRMEARYNANDSLSCLVYGEGSFEIGYLYNEKGLVSHIPGVLDSVTYNAAKQVSAYATANGVTYTFTYDNRGRLKEIVGPAHPDPDHFFNRSYQYDVTGNLISESGDSGAPWITYGYDEHHQLVEVTYSAAIYNGSPDQSFSYDELGNRLQKEEIFAGQTQTYIYNYAYDDGGDNSETRLKTIKKDNETLHSYGHYSDGKLKAIDNQTYFSYDVWDRLVRVCDGDCSNGDVLVTLVYDATDNLVRRDTAEGSTFYFYFNDTLVAQKHVDGEMSYFTNLHGKKVARHNADGSSSYFHLDALGSTRVMSDDQGEMFYRADYKPFGGLLMIEADELTEWRFTGGRYDDTAKSTHLGARHLYHSMERFGTVDPLWELRPWESPYLYAGNNPLTRTDRTGQSWVQVADDLIFEGYKLYNKKGEVDQAVDFTQDLISGNVDKEYFIRSYETPFSAGVRMLASFMSPLPLEGTPAEMIAVLEAKKGVVRDRFEDRRVLRKNKMASAQERNSKSGIKETENEQTIDDEKEARAIMDLDKKIEYWENQQ